LHGRRVDFLITGLEMGGAETQLIRLAASLSTRGYSVRVISMCEPGALGPAMRATGVPLLHLGMHPGTPDPRGLLRLLGLWRRQPPQSIVSFLYHANLLGRLAGRLANVPLIVSSIRNERFGSKVRDVLLRTTDGLGHVNVANSNLAAQALQGRGVVPRRGIQVIPNGIPPSVFRHRPKVRVRVRAEVGFPADSFVWICVGRMVPQKDHHTLLLAFERLRSTDARLLLVGGGPLSEDLKEFVNRVGLNDRVMFLGQRRDVRDLLGAADALVLSSAWEGLPNVVMEAFAAGLPVLATAVGGLPELVTAGESGCLVAPGDPLALANAMRELQSLSVAHRRRMGRRGQEQLAAVYDLEKVVDKWEALLMLHRPANGFQ
jgi:glycosyltransferase involved in cell wall biosynthesis